MGVLTDIWRALSGSTSDPPPSQPSTERDYLLSLDAALHGSEITVSAIAGILADIAHRRTLSAVEISEKRIATSKYLEQLRAARALIQQHLQEGSHGGRK